MVFHAADMGLALPPAACEVLDGLASDARSARVVDTAALRRAHEALARTVAPAKPRSLALLYVTKDDGKPRILPIRLVRSMLYVACGLLAVFLVCVFAVARIAADDGGATAGDVPTIPGLLYIVSAAGLGAAFYALFTATRYANERIYDEQYESFYWTRFVLGVVGGSLLAILLLDWQPLATANLTAPILALIGGFSADIVQRVLRRIVETIDALLRGQKEPETEPVVTPITERERVVLNLVERERMLREASDDQAADAIHAQLLAIEAGAGLDEGRKPS